MCASSCFGFVTVVTAQSTPSRGSFVQVVVLASAGEITVEIC